MKILLIGAAILIILNGCKSEQWATKKLAKVDYHQPQVPEKFCADKYPPRVYDSTRVVVRPGAIITRRDTTIQTDTVTMVTTRTVTVDRIIRDTIEHTNFRQVENIARVQQVTMERDQSRMSQAVAESQAKEWKGRFWIAFIIACVLAVWKILNFTRTIPF